MAMDQFVNQAAKNRYMFGGQASIPVVFRSAMFYGLNTGAHHSDRPYPMFMNVPGLKIVAPAFPSDAKGLLRTAVDSDDPVLIFEACMLWGTKEEVARGGVPDPVRAGPHRARGLRRHRRRRSPARCRRRVKAADELAAAGHLGRGDRPAHAGAAGHRAVIRSVQRTGRLVVADPAHRTCGAAAEISALVAEEAFESPARPDRAGDHAGHADPVQPGAGEAAVPQPHARDRRRGRAASAGEWTAPTAARSLDHATDLHAEPPRREEGTTMAESRSCSRSGAWA